MYQVTVLEEQIFCVKLSLPHTKYTVEYMFEILSSYFIYHYLPCAIHAAGGEAYLWLQTECSGV